jgi:hypothetical protein
MTQTLAGTIAGPITLSDTNATILPGAFVFWYQPYGGHAIVAPIGVTSTVSNSGTIAASVGYGIDLGAGTFANAKGGAVIATMGAVYNFAAGGPLTVANQGLIAGYITGVVLNHAGLVTNAAGADIAGGSVGIRLVASGTVNNAGTIASYTIGIQGTTSDVVTNSVGGEIYGGSGGVSGVSVLRNSGLVRDTGAAGIAVTAIYVANTGTIRGTTAFAGTTLVNSGIVSGAGLGVLAATVTNAGQILGGSGGALRLSAGGRLVLQPGFLLSGNVDGGSTANSVLELAGTGAATYLGALGTTIVDFGTVSVDSGANWIFGSLDTIAPSQRLTVAGTLASGARITEGAYSISVTSGSLRNSGVIAAGGVAVGVAGGYLGNSGTINSTGALALQLSGGTLSNTGTIAASGTAVDAAGGYLSNIGTITSAGTLAVHLAGGATFNDGAGRFLIGGMVAAAGGDAIRADPGAPALIEVPGSTSLVRGTVDGGNAIGSPIVSTLVVSGMFATLGGLGSHYVNFGLVELPSPLTATGGNIVAAGQKVDAYQLFTTGSFVNHGALTGGVSAVAGTLFNDATIESGGIGIVAMNGGGTTIVNAGTVRGHGDVGILLSAGTTLVNEAGGFVTADVSAFGPGSTLASFAVQLTNGGLVTNTGTLAARYGVIGGGTVINAGTIVATAAGTAVSMQDSLTSSRLVVEPGAVFIGGLDGGQTATPYTATLEFGAGSGTLTGFGVNISNFDAITLDAGAHWLLAGNAAGVAAQPVQGFAPGSTLELTGTVESYAGLAGGLLTLSGGTTLDLPGVASVGVTSDGVNTFITACFARGTRIATARGCVPVEQLAPGDLVLTVSGRLSPIAWLGHRTLDLGRHARPYDVMPVRVRAGAFAEKVPARDVILSPDHAVLVEGALVPVRHLVNGSSIVQQTRASITYWHLELSRHDVILAEGLACETYLDTGNRSAFEGGPALDLHPDFAQRRSLAIWAAHGCAAILTDPATAALRARHTRLLALASVRRDRFRRAASAATIGA